MRIKGNLLQGARPIPAHFIAPAVWLLAAGMAMVAIVLGLDAAELRAQRPDDEARLSRLVEQKALAAREASLPPKAELDAMARRVQALNTIAGTRGLDTSELLAWLEQRLPDDVQLVRLHHRAREGETHLIAESAATEPLAKLLRELEQEPRFAEVLLARQGTRSVQGRAAAVQFEIRIKHRT
jgi:hypothetical protein